MPSSPIISVRGLGKKYILGETLRHDTFRDHLASMARGLFHRGAAAGAGPKEEEFWALKDVSFDVQDGEVLGIIGRNGAGKSTLLKVLSRITEPTTGEVRMRGRVASLLEVGTGFHPELTGRENVFLNGAILGMRQAEIKAKFDEIVAFSGVERFLDTPVKRYSSGMYVRLAFAVAANLEPEILIIDEVLAVGDAEFQKKCLGKMQDVAGRGRTVLFVSHNMAAVKTLCSRSLALRDGSLVDDGASLDVVARYIGGTSRAGGYRTWPDRDKAPGNARLRLHAVRIRCAGKTTADVDIGQDVMVDVEFWNLGETAAVSVSLHLLDRTGLDILATGIPGRVQASGLYRATCIFPANFLNNIDYTVNAILITNVTNIVAWERDVVSFSAHEISNVRGEYVGPMIGCIRPTLAWETTPIDGAQPLPLAAGD